MVRHTNGHPLIRPIGSWSAAHRLWAKLVKTVVQTTSLTRVMAYKALSSLTLTTEDVDNHIFSILSLVNEYQGSGDTIPDADQATILMSSLPD